MEGENLDKYTLEYLERQLNNLSKLLEINHIINATLDIGKLLTLIMEEIKSIMETETSTLLLFEEESDELVFKVALGDAGQELIEKYRVKIGQGIAGWVAENRTGLYINDVYGDVRFDPNFDKLTGFKTKAIICVPLLYKGKLLGAIQAINPIIKSAFDDDDMILFKAFANQAVLAVQNAIFFQNAIEEERIKYELSSAASIQKSLLPIVNDKYNNVQIATRTISANEVGGEFYDIFHFNDNSIGIALGDTHTKGIPGAIYASIVSGAVKGISSVYGENPSKLLKLTNQIVRDNHETISNVSLFYGVINSDERTLQFVNAGVAYPILIRNGVARYLKFENKSLEKEIELPKRVKVILEPGDFFVIITDGIVNIRNRGAKHLGLKRIMDILGGEFNNPEQIIESLIKLGDDFADGLEKRQDISVIAFHIEE